MLVKFRYPGKPHTPSLKFKNPRPTAGSLSAKLFKTCFPPAWLAKKINFNKRKTGSVEIAQQTAMATPTPSYLYLSAWDLL